MIGQDEAVWIEAKTAWMICACLSDEETGILFRAILLWQIKGTIPRMPCRVYDAFCFLKDGIEEDSKRFNRAIRNRKEKIKGRRTPEYLAWRASVYQRDNYTCQRCGQYGGRLNAHHIMPYALYPHLRTDLDNGITLCEKCHKEVHRRG